MGAVAEMIETKKSTSHRVVELVTNLLQGKIESYPTSLDKFAEGILVDVMKEPDMLERTLEDAHGYFLSELVGKVRRAKEKTEREGKRWEGSLSFGDPGYPLLEIGGIGSGALTLTFTEPAKWDGRLSDGVRQVAKSRRMEASILEDMSGLDDIAISINCQQTFPSSSNGNETLDLKKVYVVYGQASKPVRAHFVVNPNPFREDPILNLWKYF